MVMERPKRERICPIICFQSGIKSFINRNIVQKEYQLIYRKTATSYNISSPNSFIMIHVFSFSVVFSAITFVLAGKVPTENKCPGIFRETRITDCWAFPCTLYKGKEYTVEIDFSPFRTTNSSVIKCNTIYYGQPFEVPESQACKDITPDGCPINPDGEYTYTQKFTIPHFVPSGNYPIKCSFVDEDKNEHICLTGGGRII